MQIEFKLITQLVAKQRGKCSSVLSVSSDEAFDEDILRQMAYEHKVEACLYKESKNNPSLLSQESIIDLKKNVALALSKRTIMQQRWSIIEYAFKKEGIKPLIIKGPASSLQLYGNPVTREYTDIDLVIAPKQFSRVVPIMKSIGYIEKNETSHLPDSMSKSKKDILVQRTHHLIFTNPQSPFRIEIHNAFFSGLSNNEKYTTEAVMKRSITLSYQEVNYNVPKLTDHVLLLIMHGSKHAWMTLHWLIDMVAVFSIEDNNLHSEICSGIEDLGLQKHTALMVALIKELFSIEIPLPYMTYYTHYQKTIRKQLAIAKHKLISKNDLNQSIWELIGFSWRYSMPLAGTAKEKFKIGINPFLISPQDLKRLKLPKPFMWIHIIIRPLFVIERRLKRRWRKDI